MYCRATVAAFSATGVLLRSFGLALKTTRRSTHPGPPPLTRHALVMWLCLTWTWVTSRSFVLVIGWR